LFAGEVRPAAGICHGLRQSGRFVVHWLRGYRPTPARPDRASSQSVDLFYRNTVLPACHRGSANLAPFRGATS
jgi:hypothetical protein